jgi:hypothetical protein
MEKTVRIYYRGHVLNVNGFYEKGEPRELDYPGSPSDFEIYHIHLEQHEVSDLLEENLSEIEILTINKIEGR